MGERLRRIQHLVVRGAEFFLVPARADVTPEERMRYLRISNGFPKEPDDVNWLIRRTSARLTARQMAAETLFDGVVVAPHRIADKITQMERERVEGLNPDKRLQELKDEVKAEIKEIGLRWPLPSKEI